ncbi:MAG: YeiH family protein, partial [Steroidobacteraceae bacterium]
MPGYLQCARTGGPPVSIITSQFRQILPGLAFAAALAVAAKLLSLAAGGAVSAVLLAIVSGMLWRNLVGIGRWADSGVAFAGETLLRLGIALIGLRLTLALLADVSLTAVPVVIACIAIALMSAVVFGRMLGVAPGIRHLLAAGTAICGCTAIIAVAPILRSRQQDVGVSIACIVLFGSIAMIAYPWFANLFFEDDAAAAGMFFGASVQDTSQVVGAALIYAQQFGEPDAVAIAGFTKFMRTFGLIVLVPVAAMWMARSEAQEDRVRAKGLRPSALPWFVSVFILLVGVRTMGDAWVSGPAWREFLAVAQRSSEMLLL